MAETPRTRPAGLFCGGWSGLLWGGLAGGAAGLFLAAEIIVQNPGIQGFRDRASVLLFFPVLYAAVGAGIGLLTGSLAALLPLRPRILPGRALHRALVIGVTAGLFLLADALARCHRCHVWYRPEWPSLTVTVGQSLLSFVAVSARGLLFGALIGAAAYGLGRWGSGRRNRRALLAAIGVAACLVLVGQAVLRPVPRPGIPRYASEMASSEDSIKVRLIVLDGADWRILGPLVESGRAPHMAGLIARGTSGPLGVLYPCVSPYMWTSISTGFSDDVHGLCDFYSYRPPGGTALITRFPGGEDTSKRFLVRKLSIPLANAGIGMNLGASSAQKRVPELWDYLSMAGKRVCVVGWRYSYPATAVNGVMVTDRFGSQARREAQTYPADLVDRLPQDFSATTEAGVRSLVGAELAARAPEQLGRLALPMERIRLHLGHDAAFAAVGRALIDSLKPDFAAVGLTATDAIAHRFMLQHVLGSRPGAIPWSDYFRRFTSEKEVELFGPTLERTYAYCDSLVGALTEDAGDDLVVIISDHGHDQDGSGHRGGPPGILIMAGGPVRRGARIEGATIRDLLPTLLHVMGLPLASSFPGRVLEEGLDPAWMESHPVRYLDLENEQAGSVRGTEMPRLTEEELDQLRSLGYVE